MMESRDHGGLRGSRDRDVEKEQKRRDMFLTVNQTIDRLLQKMNQSLKMGRQREKILMKNINENQTIMDIVEAAFTQNDTEKIRTPIRQMDDSDVLTIDTQKSRVVSNLEDIFDNNHISEQQKFIADNFFEVFSVLVWDLLRTYRPKKFHQIISKFETFDFDKYTVTKSLISGLGIDKSKLNLRIQELKKELNDKPCFRLCQQDPFLQQLLQCIVKYILCQRMAKENNPTLMSKLQNASKNWSDVQQTVENLIKQSLFSLDLKKSQEDQYCFIDQDAKMVILKVKEYDYFEGHVERISKLSPFRKNK